MLTLWSSYLCHVMHACCSGAWEALLADQAASHKAAAAGPAVTDIPTCLYSNLLALAAELRRYTIAPCRPWQNGYSTFGEAHNCNHSSKFERMLPQQFRVFQAIPLPTDPVSQAAWPPLHASNAAGATLPGAKVHVPATAAIPFMLATHDAPYSPTVIPNPNL